MYDLKPVAHLWFDTFKKEIQKLEFVQSYYNSTLYLNNNRIYVVVYGEYLHIVRLNLLLVVELKYQQVIKYKTTNFGSTFYYMGMEVLYNNHTITAT